MKNRKFALIYNFAQHYREAIFMKLDKELNFDFYFGDFLDWAPDIKKMDTNKLNGFKYELRNKRIFKIFVWQVGALKHVIKNDYTHIVLYGDPFYLSNFFILLYCRLKGIKTFAWTHGLNTQRKSNADLYNKIIYNLFDKFLLYGNYSKEIMISKGFNKDKLLVIYNSLNYDKQLIVRQQLRNSDVYNNYFKNNKPVFVYIGRIQRTKKIEQVISALEILKNTEFEFNFVVIGEDKENVNLGELIHDKNLQDNVWLYGSSYDEVEIGNLIYNAIGCISPGNIGLTAMHSLVYGTPAFTHNDFENQGPEFEAIVEGETGEFFKINDVFDMVKVIKKWIGLQQTHRQTVRENCYKKIDTLYNPNYQIKKFKSL